MKNKNQQLRLLPQYFKIVGISIFLLSIVLLTTSIAFEIQLHGVFSQLTFDAMLLGLLVFSMAKDKIEDEYIQFLRTQSIVWAFFFAILLFVFQPLINWILGLKVVEMKGEQIISTLLFGYIGTFYFYKWKMK